MRGATVKLLRSYPFRIPKSLERRWWHSLTPKQRGKFREQLRFKGAFRDGKAKRKWRANRQDYVFMQWYRAFRRFSEYGTEPHPSIDPEYRWDFRAGLTRLLGPGWEEGIEAQDDL